ncbi:hypothetical protein RRG08_007783 [Elysia crispata]|uniref:Uncharacterized protein n=1 Tax=Elysia crispata TaxID=231223 RepID=A0AAE1E8Y0_9GAST|nr:hypothetical protein RRG08_007783 [Elysia crispata]
MRNPSIMFYHQPTVRAIQTPGIPNLTKQGHDQEFQISVIRFKITTRFCPGHPMVIFLQPSADTVED